MAGQADLVVIGGGPAGAVSAWLAARDGARVVLVDPDRAPARAARRAHAQETAATSYCWEVYEDRLLDLIDKVAAER